jgi:hypothetical protein
MTQQVDPNPPEESGEYELVMPFVVTESAGGPYADNAFVAGYACGSIDAELSMLSMLPQGIPALPGSRYVPTGIVPQLDLIAMNYGYVINSEPWDEHPDEWTRIDFAYGEGL